MARELTEGLTMASVEDFMAARDDTDLTSRVVAAAQMYGVASAVAWVQSNLPQILTASITDPGVAGGTTTIADAYAYAAASYKPAPTPGANTAAVTDNYLQQAIESLQPPKA